jgi:glucose-1-phosphate cytidylyltransferase
MDTLKDKQILEDRVEKGTMPWLLNRNSGAASVDAKRRIG